MSDETKEKIKEATAKNKPFWVCLVITIALLVAGFIVPPTGVIDGSVLKGASILLGFAALYTIYVAIDKGVDAKVQHGNTTVTVGDLEAAPMPQIGAEMNDNNGLIEEPC